MDLLCFGIVGRPFGFPVCFCADGILSRFSARKYARGASLGVHVHFTNIGRCGDGDFNIEGGSEQYKMLQRELNNLPNYDDERDLLGKNFIKEASI